MAARFDEAIRLAEEAFTSELVKLVSHLGERFRARKTASRKCSAIRPSTTCRNSSSGSVH